MKLKQYIKIFFALTIVLPTICFSVLASNDLLLQKTTNELFVYKGAEILFKVPMGNMDDAFLAGNCVIVRRQVQRTELFPKVDSLDIFHQKGNKRTYSEKSLGIRRINNIRVLTSPERTWSVIPDEEEGMVLGFFLITNECAIQEVRFPHEGYISWESLGGNFLNENILLLPSLKLKLPDKKAKTIKISINNDGTYLLSDVVDVIEKAAKINNCTPAGNLEKKYAYLKHLKKWYIKSEANNSSAIIFWCKNKEKPTTSRGRFFLVISSTNAHPWSQCPSTIGEIHSTPTNLKLFGLDISAGYDQGGYYFKCDNKKWQIKSSD